MVEISKDLYDKLVYLGIIDPTGVREGNVGTSNYSNKEHIIQPWTIWLDYPNLTSWDHDIIKRTLRSKTYADKSPEESRIEDYEKIKHICDERIRQLTCK